MPHTYLFQHTPLTTHTYLLQSHPRPTCSKQLVSGGLQIHSVSSLVVTHWHETYSSTGMTTTSTHHAITMSLPNACNTKAPPQTGENSRSNVLQRQPDSVFKGEIERARGEGVGLCGWLKNWKGGGGERSSIWCTISSFYSCSTV